MIRIASLLKRSSSTISRGLKRNTGIRGYRPDQAQHLSESRRSLNGRVINEATWNYAESKLRLDWHPEQISAHACIRTETIYQRIYANKCRQAIRRLPSSPFTLPEEAQETLWHDRPTRHNCPSAVVEGRCRIGDWAADTLVGRNLPQAIVSLIERKSGFTLIRKLVRKTAKEVCQAITRLLKPFRLQVLTITSDNDREFAHHETIAKQLQAGFYFAHPYASYERGTNENTNGLTRQYFPKK